MIMSSMPYMRRAVSTIVNPREDGETVFVSDLTCGHCKTWGLPAGVYMPVIAGPVFLHCERCAAEAEAHLAAGVTAAEAAEALQGFTTGVIHGV